MDEKEKKIVKQLIKALEPFAGMSQCDDHCAEISCEGVKCIHIHAWDVLEKSKELKL